MDYFKQFIDITVTFIPVLMAIFFVVIFLTAINIYLKKKWLSDTNLHFRFQLLMLVLYFVGGIVILVSLPLNDTLKGQLLSLIGILLSAAIALSSTTFIGNVLAGIMLKVVNSTRPGDFVSVENIMGRVSEMDLLHVEIQTEDRDLITVPNLYMIQKPIKVTRSSGTIISAEVSLGYDVSRKKVIPLLKQAVEKADLSDGFVQVRELGDFSIVYRVAGLLKEVTSMISARSKLREHMLDVLHQADIEIVSPNFMNTKALDKKARFIPQPLAQEDLNEGDSPEDVIFDKADSAASIEKIKKRMAAIKAELADHKDEKITLTDFQLRKLELENQRLIISLEEAEEQLKKSDEDD